MSQVPNLRVVPGGAAGAPTPSMTSPARLADPCCFGPFELQIRERRLLAHGRLTEVRGKALDLLVQLAAHAGQLVTRQQLLDTVWADVVVEDNNLSVQINALRKVLGAGLITTVPGYGYRFNGGVLSAPVAAAPTAVPPARVAGPSHLPSLVPDLIGRDADLAALTALLAARPQVTLTGAGGIGKTRLAQAWLHGQRAAFRHGVCFVELADLGDAGRLPAHLAAALGLRLPAQGDAILALAQLLAPLSMAVVLDNAEHLTAAVAAVVQALLHEAPGVRLLVTSQSRLQIQQEQVFRLGALAWPPPQATPEVALTHGAVALFVARAQAQDHRFVLAADNVGAVVELCRRLDGSALAIELAAARLPLLGVHGLLASLAQRLQVLTRARRDAPPRQRTLRLALGWSHGLLEPAERVVWRRLAVFLGSFSLRQAQQVLVASAAPTDGPLLDEDTVLEALTGLVEKSLLSAAEGAGPAGADPSPRFALLESPRALALELLQAAGEAPGLQQPHAQALCDTLECAHAMVLDGRAGFAPLQLALEHDLPNAQAALQWALVHDGLLALRIAPLLSMFFGRQRYDERTALWQAVGPLLAQALPLPDGLRARACLQQAEHVGITRPQQALELARQASQLALQAGDLRVAYLGFGKVAHAAWRQGDRAALQAALRSAQQIEQPGWPPYLLLMRTGARGWLCLLDQDAKGALAHFEDQAALSRAAGLDDTLALINITRLQLDAPHAGQANLQVIEQAVRQAQGLVDRLDGGRNQHLLGSALNALLLAQLTAGQHSAARLTAQRLWPLARRFEMHASWADATAQLLVAEGQAQAALQLVGHADAAFAALGQAREAADQARRDRAVRQAQEALAAAGSADDGPALLAQGTRLALDRLPALARLLPA
ncbi:MAG: winged helix-turn-helix domain-containing protein [Rubrivivax sp.]|nr:winged helix-turn-helix domain-containing protein [Rubrivivax sp.]